MISAFESPANIFSYEEKEKGFYSRLLELSNPVNFEKGMEDVLEMQGIELDFAESSLDTRSSVAELTGSIGGGAISQETIDGAKSIMRKFRDTYEKLRTIDLSKISEKAASGIKDFLKGNWFNLTPFLIVPTAGMMGGDVDIATKASIQLSVGMFALDKALDEIMDAAEDVIPPQYMVALIAGTTNLAELGASQASAIAGDALEDVAATPLGSNPTNIYLTGFAALAALKDRAKKEGIIKEGESLGLKTTMDTFKKIEWGKAKKELGMAGVFALDAIIFQTMVRPAMKTGNLMPLAGWLGINAPLLVQYFKTGIFNKKNQLKHLMEGLGDKQINDVRKYFKSNSSESPGITPLIDMLTIIEKEKNDNKTENIDKVKELLEKLKINLENDQDFKTKIEIILERADMKDLEVLLKHAKIKIGDKKVNKKKVAKLLVSMASVAGLSVMLDAGVTNMAKAMPGFGKGAAGFFVMSFFSSIGEFITSKKYFQKGRDKDAIQNISDSNAINIGLANAAMTTSVARSAFL